MNEYTDQQKAEALRYIVENYGDDFVKDNPDQTAFMMEIFIAGMTYNHPNHKDN